MRAKKCEMPINARLQEILFISKCSVHTIKIKCFKRDSLCFSWICMLSPSLSRTVFAGLDISKSKVVNMAFAMFIYLPDSI